MTITIADGRGALWQWDTGRRVKITDGDGVKQVHYQNRCFGRSVDVDVGTDGTAIIPDEMLQDWHPLTAYAYVTDDAGGYTKVQVDFAVHRRARPADYVYTPTEHAGFDKLRAEIGNLDDLTTEAKANLVEAINEAAASGGGGADWSQNDPDGDGYVANRPGGYDIIETRKILETTLVSADDDNNIIADANFSLAEGDSVHVSIGGAPEVTHKVSVTTSTGGGPAVLYSFGSKSYDEIAAGGFAATDYIVMWYDNGGKWVYMRGAGADLVGKTIVARADVATSVKIPGKYLEFVINATLTDDTNCTLDKTFAQIREAVQAGNNPVVHLAGRYTSGTNVMPLSEDYGTVFVFRMTISIDTGNDSAIGQYIISLNNEGAVLFQTASGLALNSDGNLPQQTMNRDPKQPMQIATKQYVDNRELILKSTTPNSTKKFKITVDDTGALSAVEVTK